MEKTEMSWELKRAIKWDAMRKRILKELATPSTINTEDSEKNKGDFS